MAFFNRTAVVTGAGGNIGFAICRQLGEKGVKIAATDINFEAASCTAESMKKMGYDVTPYQHDVTSCENTKKVFTEILAEFGKIDILVNNAGAWVHTDHGSRHFMEQMPEEEWLRIFRINLDGTFRCTQQVIPSMVKQHYGRIINLTSVAATAGVPGMADYSASKAGVLMLTKVVAMENAKRGITCNSVSPGMICPDKPFPHHGTWLGRTGTADDIARAIVFLAEDEAGFITGEDISADGGRTLGCHGIEIDTDDCFHG